jgi:endonuclease/exonuclease/phosphatase family metal-dependent hydrolase
VPSSQTFIGPQPAPELHVMTYNIRRRMRFSGMNNPDRWSHRMQFMRGLLSREQPAIVGVQEALTDQSRFVARSLGPFYRAIGHGRNANLKGEACPIFWDPRRLELQHWTQHWLSDTPGVSGSTSWGNRIPRIAVDARFVDLSTGLSFRFLNTHFDHQSQKSRVQSGRMIANLIDNTPTIVTGDFNTDVGTVPYTQMMGPLNDAFEIADDRLSDEWGTFPNYGPPTLDRKRIDWILTSQSVSVIAAGINPKKYPESAASDHLPVQAVVRFG